MTESMAFLAAASALLRDVLALERPTVLRQLVVLAAIAAAFLTRSQFGVLSSAGLLALGLHWWIQPASRPRGVSDLVRFWPTVLPPLAAILGLGARVATGSSPLDSLGAY